ncbi:MAG: hypothetical protein ACRCZO_11165 [Cetobacterium sp.]
MLKNELTLVGKTLTLEELNSFMMENSYYNLNNDLNEHEINDCLNEKVIAFESKLQESDIEIYTYIEFEVLENGSLKIENVFEM